MTRTFLSPKHATARPQTTEYHELTDQGHFTADDGKVTFPELVAAIKQRLNVR